jgi:hypothetical protein
MPNLPDIPGKGVLGGTTRRAKAIAGGAGAGALAVGGFVAKRVLDARGAKDDDEDQAGPTLAVAPEPVAEPKPPEPEAAPKPKPAKPEAPKPPKAKAAGSKPKDAKPKDLKPKPAKPTKDAASSKPPKPKAGAKPKAAAKPKAPKSKAKAAGDSSGTPPATTGTDAPTVPGAEPGDQRGGKDPHHSLNNPVGDPDPTEYPDPFDHREDPLDPADPDGLPFGEEPHPPTGAESTSEPPLSQDPEVGDRAKPPRRENLDD